MKYALDRRGTFQCWKTITHYCSLDSPPLFHPPVPTNRAYHMCAFNFAFRLSTTTCQFWMWTKVNEMMCKFVYETRCVCVCVLDIGTAAKRTVTLMLWWVQRTNSFQSLKVCAAQKSYCKSSASSHHREPSHAFAQARRGVTSGRPIKNVTPEKALHCCSAAIWLWCGGIETGLIKTFWGTFFRSPVKLLMMLAYKVSRFGFFLGCAKFQGWGL